MLSVATMLQMMTPANNNCGRQGPRKWREVVRVLHTIVARFWRPFLVASGIWAELRQLPLIVSTDYSGIGSAELGLAFLADLMRPKAGWCMMCGMCDDV